MELQRALESSAIFKGFAYVADLAEIRTYSAGQTVLDSGIAENVLGVVVSGRLSVSRIDGSHVVPLNTLTVGGCYGASTLFCSSGVLSTSVRAETDCTIAVFSEQTVRGLVEKDSTFAIRYIEFLTGRIRFLNTKITDFTGGSAVCRVAGELVRSARDGVCRISSYTVLAKELDIGRASLYRALDELEASGEISRDGKTVTIVNSDALKRRVSI